MSHQKASGQDNQVNDHCSTSQQNSSVEELESKQVIAKLVVTKVE
jgi:hypothetical protein